VAVIVGKPTPQQVDLAARLRHQREDLGLTQVQLATALSREKPVQAPTVSTWESTRSPVRPSSSRIEAYARLAATAKRAGGPVLAPIDVLSEDERRTYAETLRSLTDLYDAADVHADPEEPARAPTFWDFTDDGPLTIICPSAPDSSRGPLANPDDPNYTESHAWADVDALIDLYGHIRMEVAGRFMVNYRSATDYRVDDLSGHLVLIGGIGWNEFYLQELQPALTRLPVQQIEIPTLITGEIFEARSDDGVKRFEPEWITKPADPDNNLPERKSLYRDIGYIARTRNPFNPGRSLTICNGTHSRGVLGAVRTLTDIRFRKDNEAYIAEHFPDGEFAVLIKVPVVQGKAIGVSLADRGAVLFSWAGENP